MFPIATSRLRLRAPIIDDLSGYIAYRNELGSLRSQMLDPVGEEQAAAFLHHQTQMKDDAFGWRMFAIEQLECPGIIGEVGIFIGEKDPRQGDLGWWLHPNHRKRGFATEAAKALVAWCFVERGLHRITANCLSSNDASRNTMSNIGMRLETLSLESRFSAGRWHDEVGYALLQREWGDKPFAT